MRSVTPTPEDLANIPHPTGAVRVYEWENDDQPIGAAVDHVYEKTNRFFVGTARFVSRSDTDDIKVWIDGMQYADGRIERNILVQQLHPDEPLTPGLARDFIAVLTAVANEVDKLAAHDEEIL